MLRTLLALVLLAGPALADTTVQVQPPAYIVTPPTKPGAYRVTPLPFPVTIPDPAGLAAHGTRLDALEAAVRALQPSTASPATAPATTPVPVPIASVSDYVKEVAASIVIPKPTPGTVPNPQNAQRKALNADRAKQDPPLPPLPDLNLPPEPVAANGVLSTVVGPGEAFPYIYDAVVACLEANSVQEVALGKEAASKSPTCGKLYVTVKDWPGEPDHYTSDPAKASRLNRVTGRPSYGQLLMKTVVVAAPGSRPKLSIASPSDLYYVKGFFYPYDDFTLVGFDCDGGWAGTSYILGCVRPEPATDGRTRTITLINNEFHNWQNGNLGTAEAGATWNDFCNYYHDNSRDATLSNLGNGTAHNVYVAGVKQHNVYGMVSIRQYGGHLFKSRAQAGVIENSVFADTDSPAPPGQSSYGVNLAEGGVWRIKHSFVWRGAAARNGPALTFAEEPTNPYFPLSVSAGGTCTGNGCSIVPDDHRQRSLTLDDVTVVSTDDPANAHQGTLGLWFRMPGASLASTGFKWFGPTVRTSQVKQDGPTELTYAMPGDVTRLATMPRVDLTPKVCPGPTFSATP